MSSLVSPQSKISWKCAEEGKRELKLITCYTSLSRSVNMAMDRPNNDSSLRQTAYRTADVYC